MGNHLPLSSRFLWKQMKTWSACSCSSANSRRTAKLKCHHQCLPACPPWRSPAPPPPTCPGPDSQGAPFVQVYSTSPPGHWGHWGLSLCGGPPQYCGRLNLLALSPTSMPRTPRHDNHRRPQTWPCPLGWNPLRITGALLQKGTPTRKMRIASLTRASLLPWSGDTPGPALTCPCSPQAERHQGPRCRGSSCSAPLSR